MLRLCFVVAAGAFGAGVQVCGQREPSHTGCFECLWRPLWGLMLRGWRPGLTGQRVLGDLCDGLAKTCFIFVCFAAPSLRAPWAATAAIKTECREEKGDSYGGPSYRLVGTSWDTLAQFPD